MNKRKPGIYIAPNRKIWPHELRVAETLAKAGHRVEFLKECNIRSPDISLDGIQYEIKSPENARMITIERAIKKALKQSQNLIIDSSRMRKAKDDKVFRMLVNQARIRKQIKKMLFITKDGKILDVFEYI